MGNPDAGPQLSSQLCTQQRWPKKLGNNEKQTPEAKCSPLKCAPPPSSLPGVSAPYSLWGRRGELRVKLWVFFLSLVFQRALAGNSSNSRLVGSLLGSDRRSGEQKPGLLPPAPTSPEQDLQSPRGEGGLGVPPTPKPQGHPSGVGSPVVRDVMPIGTPAPSLG